MKKDYEDFIKWQEIVKKYVKSGNMLNQDEDADLIKMTIDVFFKQGTRQILELRSKSDFHASLFCLCAKDAGFRNNFIEKYRYDPTYYSGTLISALDENIDDVLLLDFLSEKTKLSLGALDKRLVKTFQAIWSNSSFDERVNICANDSKILITDKKIITSYIHSTISKLITGKFTPELIVENSELIAIMNHKKCSDLFVNNFKPSRNIAGYVKVSDMAKVSDMEKVFGKKLMNQFYKKHATENYSNIVVDHLNISPLTTDNSIEWNNKFVSVLDKLVKKCVTDYVNDKMTSESDTNIAYKYIEEFSSYKFNRINIVYKNNPKNVFSEEKVKWWCAVHNKKVDDSLDTMFPLRLEKSLSPLAFFTQQKLSENLETAMLGVYEHIIGEKDNSYSSNFGNFEFLENKTIRARVYQAMTEVTLDTLTKAHEVIEKKLGAKFSLHPIIIEKLLDAKLKEDFSQNENSDKNMNSFSGFKI